MKIKKILSFVIILSLLLSSSFPQAWASTASPSASEAQNISSPSADLSNTPFDDLGSLKKDALAQLALSSLSQTQGSSFSLQRRLPTRVKQLLKKTFKSSEKIPVTIENDDADKVTIEVFNVNGEKVDAEVEVINNTSPAIVWVDPPRQFAPGRYRLKVTDSEGKISTQDFTWGVLAINTNKSVYQQGDLTKIHMAVLDETGNMVCDAKVKLSIKDPTGKILDHSTETGSIKVNPECQKKEYTIEPDFESRYTVDGGDGKYEMTLTAETKNGTFTINDSFQAKEIVPFDVERTTNTRIFPPLRYPVLFNIIANEDFKGEISEVVPESFDIGVIENMPEFQSKTIPAKVNGKTTTHIDLPFSDNFEMTQGFGEAETDPLLAEKYHKYGVVGHDGIDYALPMGTPVISVDDGVVVRAQENGDYGTTVIVQHSWGRSYYGHLSKMEKQEGDQVKKGDQIGLSGNTGLSTGPHLHFGIKLQINDAENGYYGKVNPLSYLTGGQESLPEGNVAGIATSSAILRNDTGDGVKILTWNVDVKKGDIIKLGYTYLAPKQSPQFYTLGPMEFISSPFIASDSAAISSQTIFRETRTWQIAVDADGSGAMTPSNTNSAGGGVDQTYTWTFTPAETMDSGGIQVQIPAGFSAPQGSPGTAGYTTAVGNTNATVGTVLNSNDSATGWGVTGGTTGDFCETFSGLDTSVFTEGTGSIRCTDPDTDSDTGDAIRFAYGSPQNWSSYTEVGYWIRVSATESSPNAQFAWNDETNLHSTPIGTSNVPSLTANTWTYVKVTLSGTLTSISAYGIRCSSNTCSLSDGNSFYIDEILIGPGVPTFSSQNINVRFLDATSGDTITITYGDGGGTSGVDNPNPGVETIYPVTTKSRTSVTGTLTDISSSPQITLNYGPSNNQLMRHGAWFSSGVEKPFTF